jgi:hypothetical protein
MEGFSAEEESVNKIHRVERIIFAGSRMLLTVDGKAYSCALADISERLAHARDFERNEYEVSPSGYGIHWPLVDEDLSIDGLLRAAKPEPSESSVYSRARSGKVVAVAESRGTYVAKKGRRVAARGRSA